MKNYNFRQTIFLQVKCFQVPCYLVEYCFPFWVTHFLRENAAFNIPVSILVDVISQSDEVSDYVADAVLVI